MPRGYANNNYSFVVDSSFRPFSMQEMVAPLVAYKDAYEKSEEAFSELTNKADKFKYLSETLPEGSRSRQIYEGYANELNKQAVDLAQNGLSMGNRRALTNLKRRYQGEIGRLATADEAMQKEKELRRTMSAKDSSMLYATDNLNIDDFLDNNTPNLYNISGTELYTRGAAAGKAASSRIYSAGDEGSTLNGYYRKWVERNGYSADSINAFRANASAIPELQQAADAILAERGVLDNLSGNNLERARQSVLNGIIDGAVYSEKVNPVRDPGVMSLAERRADSRAQQSLNMQKKAADREENWMYTHDEKGNRTGINPAYIAAYNSTHAKKLDDTQQGELKVNPAEFKKLRDNKGVTSNGTILSGAGDSLNILKMDMSASARYKPFYGDAWNNDAKNGFSLNWLGDFSENDAAPYSFCNLKYEAAKNQIRAYVAELIPDVIDGLSESQIYKVIGYMEFQRDADLFSDSHFRLRIPGTNEEGKITDKNKFNGFLSRVNQLRLNNIEAEEAARRKAFASQQPAATTTSTTSADSTSITNAIPVD